MADMNTTVGDIRRANLLLLIEEAGTMEALAEAADTNTVYLSQIRNRTVDAKTGRPREMGSRIARKLEAARQKPTGWMDRQHQDEGTPPEGMAQSVSQPQSIVLPELATWEGLMAGELPSTFRLMLRDDAMAPELRAGMTVIFSTSERARPGDAVLVRDADGNLHFREYRERRPGHWQAMPLNAAYLPALEPEVDGASVVAVMVGLWGRRGQT